MNSVFHTPGSFGNYVAFLLDCKQNGKLLESPFTESGSSHYRKVSTKSYDIVLTDGYETFKKSNMNDIAIFWDDSYFFLILHSAYGRTNSGQYGRCGAKALQENTYKWYQEHEGHTKEGNDMAHFLNGLKLYYNFDCNNETPVVPTMILQHYFFLHFVTYFENKLFIKNKELKNSNLKKISVDTILDYKKLKDNLDINFDFSKNHETFKDKNASLTAFLEYKSIVKAIINKRDIKIDNLDIITKTGILYALEVYYYDIPFYNTNFKFENTKEFIDYIKGFPNYMKRPNRLFTDNWKIYNDKKLDL